MLGCAFFGLRGASFDSEKELSSGYQAVGSTFGVMNMISAIILYALTKDPLLTKKSEGVIGFSLQ
jgi:hypothetical protein